SHAVLPRLAHRQGEHQGHTAAKRHALRHGRQVAGQRHLATTTTDVLRWYNDAERLVAKNQHAGERTTGAVADKLVAQLSTMWRHWISTHKSDLDKAGVLVPENPCGAVQEQHMVKRETN